MKSFITKIKAFFEARWYRKQLYNSEKSTFTKELFGRDLLLVLVTMVVSLFVGFVAYPILRSVAVDKNSANEQEEADEQEASHEGRALTGPQTLRLGRSGVGKGSAYPPAPGGGTPGTLVRVRLQNIVETFESVPIYAQIIDYGLGEAAFGSVLIGDATGDGTVNRIKAAFRMLKRGGFLAQPVEIEGQALSLDGTLGVRAEKVEGLATRALIASGKSGLGGLTGNSEKKDLGSLLARALLQGLQSEASSDLNPVYNNAVSLRLRPGAEFLVQITGGSGAVR